MAFSQTSGGTQSSGSFVPFLLSEIKEQTAAENKEGHVSYNWTVLRAAQGLFEAKNLVGTTLRSQPLPSLSVQPTQPLFTGGRGQDQRYLIWTTGEKTNGSS